MILVQESEILETQNHDLKSQIDPGAGDAEAQASGHAEPARADVSEAGRC